jgi:hypothetical protein
MTVFLLFSIQGLHDFVNRHQIEADDVHNGDQVNTPDAPPIVLEQVDLGIHLSRDVVPYNKYFLYKCSTHINVEHVGDNLLSVAYINKYMQKGHDRANVVLELDEIKHHMDARWLGRPKALWRVNG